MHVEIKELSIPIINGVQDFPNTGLFKVTQTNNNKQQDLVYVNLETNVWIFINPWASLGLELEDKPEEKIIPDTEGMVSEGVLLKTIAMLANKEELGKL